MNCEPMCDHRRYNIEVFNGWFVFLTDDLSKRYLTGDNLNNFHIRNGLSDAVIDETERN